MARILAATFLGRFTKIKEDREVKFYIHRGNIDRYEPPFPGKVWHMTDGEYHIGKEEKK